MKRALTTTMKTKAMMMSGMIEEPWTTTVRFQAFTILSILLSQVSVCQFPRIVKSLCKKQFEGRYGDLVVGIISLE